MDEQRFDWLTRRLGATADRRMALKGFAAGLLGLSLADGAEQVLGTNNRCNRQRDCRADQKCCNGRCRDVLTDPRFCGDCNTKCRGREQTCRNGGCFQVCRGAVAGTCDIDGCAGLCGCNFVNNGLNVCEFMGESCSDLRSCNNDGDCPSGRVCANEGCCGAGKTSVCVQPCKAHVSTAALPTAHPSPANRRSP